MRRSYNEISMMVRKAAMGAGLDYGLAEDAGHAAHWLCEHGIEGAAIALAAIENAAGDPHCHYTAGVFDAARAVTAGPSALDIASTGQPVELRDLDAPLLVAGLAASRARTAPVRFCLSPENGADILIAGDFSGAGLDSFRPGATLTVSADTLDDEHREPAVHDGAGAQVDPTIWKQIEALAAKTYVPASESSRTRGAGAGLTDND